MQACGRVTKCLAIARFTSAPAEASPAQEYRLRLKKPAPTLSPSLGVESRSGAVTPKCSVSRSRSSNRACRSPAPGFRTRVLVSFRPRQVGLEARQTDYSKLAIEVLVGKTIRLAP